MRTLDDASRMRMHAAQAVRNKAMAEAGDDVAGPRRVARDAAWDAWVDLWEELYAKLVAPA